MHNSACFAAAFEILIEQPWRDEFEDHYVTTVGGDPVDWRGRVTSALVHTWGNHIVFVPIGPGTIVEEPGAAVDESGEDEEGSDVADEGSEVPSTIPGEVLAIGSLLSIRGQRPVEY